MAGSELRVLPPAGTFTPRTLDEDLLLLAAGSGVTPVMSILKSCLAAGTGSVTLVYANRDERLVIFRDELRALTERFPERLTVLHWLESVQGIPTTSGMRALVSPYAGREVFLCGPAPFMALAETASAPLANGARRAVLVVGGRSVRRARRGRPIRSGVACVVDAELDGEVTTITWPEGNRLLDVLLDAGVDAPYSCREGRCSACACVLLDGEVTLEHNEIRDEQALSDGLILACQAVSASSRLRVSYDGC